MGLFSNLFKARPTLEQILSEKKDKVLSLYGFARPSPEDEVRAAVVLTISGIGILNDVAKGLLLHDQIDALADAGRKVAGDLSVNCKRIFATSDDLESFAAILPEGMDDAESIVTTDGQTAFVVLYNTHGPQLVSEICNKSGGPMGAPGYAAIVVGDFLVGREKGKPSFMPVAMEMLDLQRQLLSWMK